MKGTWLQKKMLKYEDYFDCDHKYMEINNKGN